MTKVSTHPQAGATTAAARPTKGLPNRRPNPPMRRVEPALPEPLTALDFAQRMQDIGLHWWALIDGLFEQLHTDKAKAAPVPEWALEWLKDQGRHDLTHEEMRSQGEALRDLLRLQEGRPARTVFEVWGDRATRLSICSLSLSLAAWFSKRAARASVLCSPRRSYMLSASLRSKSSSRCAVNSAR